MYIYINIIIVTCTFKNTPRHFSLELTELCMFCTHIYIYIRKSTSYFIKMLENDMYSYVLSRSLLYRLLCHVSRVVYLMQMLSNIVFPSCIYFIYDVLHTGHRLHDINIEARNNNKVTMCATIGSALARLEVSLVEKEQWAELSLLDVSQIQQIP